jgi:hypothetical protein
MKRVSLSDFLTPGQIELAMKLRTSQKILHHIIAPNMDRINKALGQENDARYLAYAVEYAIAEATKQQQTKKSE